MKLIDKVKALKHSIKELSKLNEDLIEKNLADKRKIHTLQRRISNLKNAIGENINDLEKFVKENNANF